MTKKWRDLYDKLPADVRARLEADVAKELETLSRPRHPIRSDKHYHITSAWADRFRAAIADAEKSPAPADVHPRLHTASIDAMRAQLRELEHELRTYDQERWPTQAAGAVAGSEWKCEHADLAQHGPNLIASYVHESRGERRKVTLSSHAFKAGDDRTHEIHRQLRLDTTI